MSYVHTKKIFFYNEFNPIKKVEEQKNEIYDEFTVYTRKFQFVVSDKFGNWQIIDVKPIIVEEHYITEYYLNKKRMGIIEIAKDIFDDINYVENLDKDDIESFVNAIMVFTNAEVDKEGMDAIKQYGAVSIKSTEQKKASVELLQSRLKSLDTQIYYLRKISALHSILSIPQANNSGEIRKIESRLNQLVKIASKLYEDYTADLINDRTYKDLLLKNKQEQDLLELKLKNLKNS